MVKRNCNEYSTYYEDKTNKCKYSKKEIIGLADKVETLTKEEEKKYVRLTKQNFSMIDTVIKFEAGPNTEYIFLDSKKNLFRLVYKDYSGLYESVIFSPPDESDILFGFISNLLNLKEIM
jgi:hypothetical protein